MKCSTLRGIREYSNTDVTFFESKAKAAIGNLVGFLSPVEAEYHRLTGKPNPKKIEESKKRLKYMSDIHNLLKKHVDELGKTSFYDPTVIDDFLNMIRDEFSDDFTEPLVDLNEYHWRRAKSFHKKLDKHFNKAAKGYKPSGEPLTFWERALWEPANLVYSRDKTGKFAKIIKMIKRSSDIIQGKARFFTTRYTNITNGLINYHNDNIWNNRDSLNSVVFGGLEGFILTSKTGKKAEVTIHGEDATRYLVSFPARDGSVQDGTVGDVRLEKKYWFSKDSINATDENLKLASQSSFQRFYQDILDGRVRYIRTAHIPSNFEENQKWREETNEGKFISKVLDEMAAQRKAADENNMTYTPKHKDYHSFKDEAGNQWSFVIVKDEAGERGERINDPRLSQKELEQLMARKDPIVGENYNAFLVQVRYADEVQDPINFFEAGTEEWFGTQEEALERGITVSSLEAVLPEGFYNAKEHKRFRSGKIIGVAEGIEEEGEQGFIYDLEEQFKEYYGFERMIGQPGSGVPKPYRVDTPPGAKPQRRAFDVEDGRGLWNAIKETRSLYQQFFDYVAEETSSLTKDITSRAEVIRQQAEKEGLDEEDIEERIENTMSIGGYKSDIELLRDKEGKLTGEIKVGAFRGDGIIKGRAMNYSPAQYWDGEYERTADEALESWERQIKALKKALSKANKQNRIVIEGKISEIEERMNIMNEVLAKLANIDHDERTIRLMNTPSHLRAVSSMMNRMNRRRDPEVASKYFERTITSLHQTRVKNEFLGVMDNDNTPSGLYDYLTNQAKIAFGETDYRALDRGKDYGLGHEQVANLLNIFSPNKKWKADDVEYYVIMANLYTTSKLLGVHASLHNNTQRLNPIILFGLRRYWKAAQEAQFGPEKDIWKARVENSGVLVLVNAFHEIMLGESGTSVTMANLPQIEYAKIASIVAMGRKKFIKNGDYKVDKMLRLMNKDEKMNAARMMELREAWIDLVDSPSNEADLSKKRQLALTKGRLKTLKRNWTRKEMRKAAIWKLKYFPPIIPGAEKVLTFTGVEAAMRFETGVLSLMIAEEMKAFIPEGDIQVEIAGRQDPADDDAMWYGEDAVDIIRNAVYNTQFGMSQQFLPHMFGGAGKFIFQYKTYPYNQSRHDYRIVKNFLDGNEGQSTIARSIDGSTRLMNLMWDGARRRFKQQNLRDEERDAQRVGRFILGRVIASFFAIFARTSPLTADVVRGIRGMIGGQGVSGSMRFFKAAENPVVGLLMRMAVLGLWFGGDEEDEDDTFKYVRRFLLPPLLSMAIEGITKHLDD